MSKTAEHLGVWVSYHEMAPGLEGLALGANRIRINKSLERSWRRRFVFAHELGHLLVRRRMAEWVVAANEELFCDAFAHELLLPLDELAVLGESDAAVENIMGAFEVDRATVVRQLAGLDRAPKQARVSRTVVICSRCGDRQLTASCDCTVVRREAGPITSVAVGQLRLPFDRETPHGLTLV